MVPSVVQRTEGRTLGSKAAGNISQKMNVSENTGWKNDTTQKYRLENDTSEKYRLEKLHNTELQAGKTTSSGRRWADQESRNICGHLRRPFFMTDFYRVEGGHGPNAPPNRPMDPLLTTQHRNTGWKSTISQRNNV